MFDKCLWSLTLNNKGLIISNILTWIQLNYPCYLNYVINTTGDYQFCILIKMNSYITTPFSIIQNSDFLLGYFEFVFASNISDYLISLNSNYLSNMSTLFNHSITFQKRTVNIFISLYMCFIWRKKRKKVKFSWN